MESKRPGITQDHLDLCSSVASWHRSMCPVWESEEPILAEYPMGIAAPRKKLCQIVHSYREQSYFCDGESGCLDDIGDEEVLGYARNSSPSGLRLALQLTKRISGDQALHGCFLTGVGLRATYDLVSTREPPDDEEAGLLAAD